MGAKGSKVQKITTDFNVQIKFPDKAVENGGDPAQSNGVTNGERSSNPNIIKITGKTENCTAASKALLELVPITAEVSVPYEFHRYIIGQKGTGVRDLMNRFDVNIRVPPQDDQFDIILMSGVPFQCGGCQGRSCREGDRAGEGERGQDPEVIRGQGRRGPQVPSQDHR